MNLKTVAATILVTASLTAVTVSAVADAGVRPEHPRREQVKQRLARQQARVDAKVAAGTMSPKTAAKVTRQDAQIRKEERLMASQNGGHITKLEQKTLNQQENKVSKEIANAK